MSDRSAHRAWAALLLGAGLFACGPSAQEVRLRAEHDELRHEIAEQRQYNDDLKLRMQLVHARNQVLIDLVEGLTAETSPPAKDSAGLGPAHASLKSLDAKLTALVMSVNHSRKDIAAMRAQRASLEEELTEAKQTLERAREEQAAEKTRGEVFRALLAQLTQLIAERQLDLRVVDNRMLLNLPGEILFASNDARVSSGGKAVLDRVAEVLRQVESRAFQVAGHTDEKPVRYGRYGDNWRLSSERALNVMLYLVERGVPKERISAAAYGATQPLAQADPKQQRRIEIVLLPKLDELPDLSQLEALSRP
jgi:chemotaxis protein MotB